MDPNEFSSELEISIDEYTFSSNADRFQGLVSQFDASRFNEANGTEISLWADSSGNSRDLDQSRGAPTLILSPELDDKKVIRFDGFSQLFSSFDFGTILGEYSIFAVARHAGTQDQAVLSSVGSDWVFGLGNQYSVYWKLGPSFEFTGSVSDDQWHIYAGTLKS